MKPSLKTLYIPMLLASFQAGAATTETFETRPGRVSSQFEITLGLQAGGIIDAHPILNDCYMGQTCSFFNSHFYYRLSDGSTATLTSFSGVFERDPSSSGYRITGEGSGTDSAGLAVSVTNVDIRVSISCRSGRGGGCTKYSPQGSFQLTR